MPSIDLPDPIFVLAGAGPYAAVVRSPLSDRCGAMSSPNVALSCGGICRPNASSLDARRLSEFSRIRIGSVVLGTDAAELVG